MFTIDFNEYTFTYEVNKSVFIAYLKHIESVDDAKIYLNSIKAKHLDATHHVSAFIIGNSGQNGRANDDGEPSRTAGAPIFEVLRKNNLTNVICIVVRYFGGIKLGAGGLVRAYNKAASEVVKLAVIRPIIDYSLLELHFSYPYLNQIEKVLQDFSIIERSFTSTISIIVKLPTTLIESICAMLTSITYGNITIKNITTTNEI